MPDVRKALQVIAVIITALWLSMLFHKGYNDISVIIDENPDNWGQAIGQYLLENWAGGKESRRL